MHILQFAIRSSFHQYFFSELLSIYLPTYKSPIITLNWFKQLLCFYLFLFKAPCWKPEQTFYCGLWNRLIAKSHKVCFCEVLSSQANFLVTFLCWVFCLHFAKHLPNRNEYMFWRLEDTHHLTTSCPYTQFFFPWTPGYLSICLYSPEAEVLYWNTVPI